MSESTKRSVVDEESDAAIGTAIWILAELPFVQKEKRIKQLAEAFLKATAAGRVKG